MTVSLTIFLLFFVSFTYAQVAEEKTKKVSGNLGLGVGYGQQIGLSVFSTIRFPNKLYTGIHIIGTSYNALNLPDDYSSPMGSPSDPPPTDWFTSFSVIIGKQMQKENSRFSLSLESGASWVRYNKLSFEKIRSPGLWGGYLTERHLTNLPGLILGRRIKYAIKKRTSLDLSFHRNLNSTRSVGFGSLSFVFDNLQLH